MKKYFKPFIELINVDLIDILNTSGVEMKNENAGFVPDERI